MFVVELSVFIYGGSHYTPNCELKCVNVIEITSRARRTWTTHVQKTVENVKRLRAS